MSNKPVSFKISQMLKGSGFDEPTSQWYHGVTQQLKTTSLKFSMNKLSDHFSAPTIAEVVMWLYKKHGIWVHVYPIMPFVGEPEGYPTVVWIAKCTSIQLPRQSAFDVFVHNSNNGLGINYHVGPEEAYEAAFEYLMSETRMVTK